MRKVTLYLDVDGVVCPFGATGLTPWGSAWRLANAGLLEVAYARELVDGLNGLEGVPGVRCVWLTSWEDMAPQYLCPAIGLNAGQWPYLAAESGGTGAGWWKLRAIQEDLGRSGADALVWIDDQLNYEQEAQAWAGILGRRIMLVSPDPRRGISPGEWAAVRTFLERPVF
ncbi:HAD domain-containing protein [Arthrobacter sp. HMWF013]|uniref:HAD domain-containing protein n=1 Tax=Arthrobacter sp. HMWF013 TaxID=2056849 RepID=UPI000D3420A6|nr:HAD domain-containing protein [Arthrobacter sp. HMWF013]PTT65328.1 hypothetical protein DBR22_12745 [Arthrobacter sp. HMWF013]